MAFINGILLSLTFVINHNKKKHTMTKKVTNVVAPYLLNTPTWILFDSNEAKKLIKINTENIKLET